MKQRIHFLLVFLFTAGGISAQNLDLYGMKGNPLSLQQNPAARTDLRFHLTLPALTTQGNLTTPLRDLWGDIGTQIRNLPAPKVGLASATDVEFLGLGFKSKKGYTWVQAGAEVDARFHLDKDLLAFGFYGMKDANGNIDPEYVGDFSSSDLGLSAMGRVTIGHQRAFSDHLRVGVSVQANRLLGGFEWSVQDWTLTSTQTPVGTNSLTWTSDMSVSAFGLIADAARLDSAMDFPRYLIMGMVPAYLTMLKAQKNSYSLNVGLHYQPTPWLTLAASANGIPLGGGSHGGGILNSRSLHWNSQFTYQGFQTGFSPQDTGTWAYYLTHLESQALDGFQIESAPPVPFLAPFSAHAAAYLTLVKHHQVGLHLSHVDRLSGVHQAMGLEYIGFFGRGLQLTTSYRWHTWAGLPGASELSTVVQHRVLPWTTFFWGTNLWLSTPGFQNGTLLLPGNFQSWQVTAGAQITLFESSYRQARQEKRAAAKAAKKSGTSGGRESIAPSDGTTF